MTALNVIFPQIYRWVLLRFCAQMSDSCWIWCATFHVNICTRFELIRKFARGLGISRQPNGRLTLTLTSYERIIRKKMALSALAHWIFLFLHGNFIRQVPPTANRQNFNFGQSGSVTSEPSNSSSASSPFRM